LGQALGFLSGLGQANIHARQKQPRAAPQLHHVGQMDGAQVSAEGGHHADGVKTTEQESSVALQKKNGFSLFDNINVWFNGWPRTR